MYLEINGINFIVYIGIEKFTDSSDISTGHQFKKFLLSVLQLRQHYPSKLIQFYSLK